MTDADLLRISRYLAGEGSDFERHATRAWIAADAERAREFDALRAAWGRAGSGPVPLTDADVDRAWRALARRKAARAAGRAGWGRLVGRAAAAVVLVAGGLATARVVARRPAAPAAPPVMREVTTGPAQRATLTLADGSRVVLGAASRLRYDSAAFGRGARAVHLDGEATFEVRHDAARPFVVRTPRAEVRDLGTRFALRDYAADAAAAAPAGAPTPEVVVAEGRVALAAPSAGRAAAVDSLVLAPGERGRLLAGGELRRERGVDVDAAFAWTRGELAFRATPLGEAAARLARWYGVTVLVPDAALARTPLTATFAAESAEEALRLTAAAVGARLDRAPRRAAGAERAFVLRAR